MKCLEKLQFQLPASADKAWPPLAAADEDIGSSGCGEELGPPVTCTRSCKPLPR